MNRIYTARKLTVFAALTLLFITIGITTAQVPIYRAGLQAPSGMSGKVVDLEGQAVAGFTFAIQPIQLQEGQLQPEGEFQPEGQEPPEGVNLPGMPRQPSTARTDVDGTFTVTGIQPGFIQLEAILDTPQDMAEMFDPEEMQEGDPIPPEWIHLGHFEPDKTIYAIQIGQVIVFNTAEEPGFFEGITFALEPGKTVENVKITVKSRLRIHARIVYADGTPLVNADDVQLNIRQRDEFNPQSGGTYSADYFTDDDGYFTVYRDIPGFYTISVKYNEVSTGKELSAGAGPFLLKDGAQLEGLVLTLDGNPVAAKPSPDNIETSGAIEIPAEVKTNPPIPPQVRQPAKRIWVINPTNGHAYTKIQCVDWHDAQQQAIEEGAHLVSINDEAEQHWLQIIFRVHAAWIGLTDVAKEGEWQWDSGETVTYTNWAVRPIFPDSLPDTEKDYVVFTFRDGEWQSVGPGSPFWQMTREAIIEKDGLVSKTPDPKAAPNK